MQGGPLGGVAVLSERENKREKGEKKKERTLEGRQRAPFKRSIVHGLKSMAKGCI